MAYRSNNLVTGRQLRAARTLAGMTQRDLAAALGINERAVRFWERLSVDRRPTVLTYGATLQYSLLYINAFVHEVPEFFRQLIPTVEAVFSMPVSNIGP